MKAVFKELWKNFWLALFLSLGWAIFRASDSATTSPISSFIANFSASLFLISWAVGQYKRVQKQLEDKQQFTNLSTSLQSLVGRMEGYTAQLAGFTLGDSSDLLLSMATDPKNSKVATFSLINEGKYPVFDVRVHWANIDEFSHLDDFMVWNWDPRIVATIKASEMEMDVLKFDMTDIIYRRIFLYITWRNGSLTKEFEISRNGESVSFQQLVREEKQS